MFKRNKTLLVIALVFAMFNTTITPLSAYGVDTPNAPTKQYQQAFSDVPTNYWAFSYVAEMAERGVISGYPDGKFRPDNQVTRAEFAKIMVSAAGLKVTKPTSKIYSDVPTTEWYAPYIYTANAYLTDYYMGEDQYLQYRPDNDALREDIAVALVKLKAYDTSISDVSVLKAMFKDYESISTNAQPYVATAVNRGLISGYEDETFRGQATITRAEAATLLWRAYQYGSDNKVVDATPVTPTATPKPTKTSAPVDDKDRVESAKPYITSTLVKKVNIEDINMHMTEDSDGDIIYYDNSEDKVFSMSPDGDVSEVFDCQDFEYEYEDITYNLFELYQVFCDNVNNKLLAKGYLTQEDDGLNPTKGMYSWVEIDNKKVKDVIDITDVELFGVLSDGSYIGLGENNSGGLNINIDGNKILYTPRRGWNVIELSDSLCFLTGDGELVGYDFKNTEPIRNIGIPLAVSIKYEMFYMIGRSEENIICSVDISNGKLGKFIDIGKDVQIADLKPIGISGKFFLTDEMNVIFYDSAAKSIRMISKQ